jgi:signal transduction histidine kinase
MTQDEKIRHRFNWRLSVLISTVCFMACFAAGYGLSLLIFGITGSPDAFWSHIIAGLLGLLVFAAGVKILLTVGAKRRGERWREARGGGKLIKDTIEALERIARGDFSVFIRVEKNNPFSGIAESVNKMARELGTMENLRQNFISNVSHEIQSPLTSIRGFAALLKNEELTAELKAHYIDVIETEAKRLSTLSDNLMRLSMLESNAQPLTFTFFSLDKQLKNAVLMLEPQWMAKNLEVSLSLEKIACSGDEGLLSQVWVNLLHNAIKFTPDAGRISVELAYEEGGIVCRISDTGAGISEEDRMHIFERFFKADKARDRALGGSGLGLSLVKKIVELHGGTVAAQSDPGKGSTFIVTLPLKI